MECWLRISVGALGQDLGLENGIPQDLNQEEAHGHGEDLGVGNALVPPGNREVAAGSVRGQRVLVRGGVPDPKVLVQRNVPVLGQRALTRLGTLLVASALQLPNDAAALGRKDGQDRVIDPETGRSHTVKTEKKENLKLGVQHVLLAREDLLLAPEARRVARKEDHALLI